MHCALPVPGTTLSGRYLLEDVLGEGASSVVFAALDLKLDRAVAVKVLKPKSISTPGSERMRFLAEARTLARLTHPHVVAIYDVEETTEGNAYIVMEKVAQGTLERELSTRGLLSTEHALSLLLPVMGALACAHDRGIVHRDLKPSNIVIERHDGSMQRAKLLDFGIAKVAEVNTSSGAVLGTPAYMAPEQASGANVDARADVWSTGVLLFRMLSGRLPFEAAGSTGVLLRIVNERATRFAVACPNLGKHIAVALDQALEPNPSARYSNMRSFARALAVACRQDGINLPLDPDPIGLPEFVAWSRNADLGATARADRVAAEKQPGRDAAISLDGAVASEPARHSVAVQPVLASTSRRLRKLALLSCVLGVLYAFWSVRRAPLGLETMRASSNEGEAELGRPTPRVRTPDSAEVAPAIAAPVEPPPAKASRADTTRSAIPLDRPHASGPGSSHRKAARSSPAIRRPPPSPARETPPASPAASDPPGMIPQWDW